MDRQKPPNIALRSLWAAAIVSFLAGPIFQWLLIAVREPDPNSELPVGAGDIGFLFLYVFPVVSLIGLVGTAPAAIANALTVAALTNRHIDGVLPAMISGLIFGTVIPVTAFHLFVSKTRNPIGGDDALTYVTCLALTGVLMGIVHWSIAIRPHRQWRLQASNNG